jgi:hypothetical protein
MNAEAVLKQRVRNEQTSGEKKSPSKSVLIFYFFPAQMQIFRPIGQTFGSRRKRVNESQTLEKECPRLKTFTAEGNSGKWCFGSKLCFHLRGIG